VFIFFGIAALLYLLDLSLSSQAGFDEAAALLSGTAVKLIIWAIASGILYHLIAGIKHLTWISAMARQFKVAKPAQSLC
jgi:succinate dehydrogenase / fumarate reductase cytochrome b subunit